MVWDYNERRKRERHYRIMFKSAIAFFVIGILLTVAGGVVAVVEANTFWLVGGLLLVLWSGVSAYLTVDSTVRIIEQDIEEGWGVR